MTPATFWESRRAAARSMAGLKLSHFSTTSWAAVRLAFSSAPMSSSLRYATLGLE